MISLPLCTPVRSGGKCIACLQTQVKLQICVCVSGVVGFRVAGGRLTVTQAPSSINAPICLTCRPVSSSWCVFLRKCSFWSVLDVNESSRSQSQGCKHRTDEVSGLFMHHVTRLKDELCIPSENRDLECCLRPWHRPYPRGISAISAPSFLNSLPVLLFLSQSRLSRTLYFLKPFRQASVL